ncbi:MAG: hypothetical protein GXO61_04105 [Epsilonproteobacteria bacterium]|nr:hypothetical protein [Campylobacterota bacterium]
MERSKQPKKVDLVVIALSSPLLVGIYEEGKLIEVLKEDKKTSQALPTLFSTLLKKYEIENIYFARGPGSFMGIKLSYIFLKTLQITKGIKLFGCEAFEFNQNAPIKAIGNLYFVKENGKIVTKKLSGVEEREFFLPKTLDQLNYTQEIEPIYILPAVKG